MSLPSSSLTLPADRYDTSDECVICKEMMTDKAFVNDCLHTFCYTCITKWTKEKAVCPLCLQPVNEIVRSVRLVCNYDTGIQSIEAPVNNILTDSESGDFNRYSDVTSLEDSYETDGLLGSQAFHTPYRDLKMRRQIYTRNLQTFLPPPQGMDPRPYTSIYLRINDDQMNRITRWLKREMMALSGIKKIDISQVLGAIINILPIYDIMSRPFFNSLNRFMGKFTAKFILELKIFASSPHKMEEYDRDCSFIPERSSDLFLSESLLLVYW